MLAMATYHQLQTCEEELVIGTRALHARNRANPLSVLLTLGSRLCEPEYSEQDCFSTAISPGPSVAQYAKGRAECQERKQSWHNLQTDVRHICC